MEGNSWVGKMDSARGFVMVKGGDRWKTAKSPRKERLAAEGLWNNEMPGSGDVVRFGGKKHKREQRAEGISKDDFQSFFEFSEKSKISRSIKRKSKFGSNTIKNGFEGI